MKKRTFVLLEFFLAIALVALVSPPLVRGISLYLIKQKKELLKMEKQRRAEELFYQVCGWLNEKHEWDGISRNHQDNPYPRKDKKSYPIPITFDLGSLGQEKLFWHYHIYSRTNNYRGQIKKFFFKICFLEHSEEKCDVSGTFDKAPYGFILTSEEEKGEDFVN